MQPTSTGLQEKGAKSRKETVDSNGHEHNLSWPPVDQLSPQVGHSCWCERIGRAELDRETSAKMV